MGQLIVRNLDSDIVALLKKRAQKSGRSVEAEHRVILTTVLRAKKAPSIRALLLSMPSVGGDDDFARTRRLGRRVKL